jgi:hypothetical protein
MKKSGVKISLLICLILLISGIGDLQAEEEHPSSSLDVAVLSQYIWRGQELSRDSIVIQPSMTVGYKGLSMNLWGNLDTDQYYDAAGDDEYNWNETDLTFCYGKEFGMLSAEAGYIYYDLDGIADTQEVYLGFGLDTLLSPSLKIYKDIAGNSSWYFLLGISHAIEMNEKVSLELSGSVSYLLSEDEDDYYEVDGSGPTGDEFENFHDGVISASLPIALTEYITITPTASYCFPLSDDASDEMEYRSLRGEDDNFIYGGVILSMAF